MDLISFEQLRPEQRAIAEAEVNASLFVSGPAGAGKTTAGVHRVLHWLRSGAHLTEVLILVPQRTIGRPYLDALRGPDSPMVGEASVLTMASLARRMVDLFWPAVAEQAGFLRPDRPPVFLTLETAQYYLARVIAPLLEQGAFEGVNIDRHRLYSQILDNLNKSAVVGFPLEEIGERLTEAWVGPEARATLYEAAQEAAELFRQACLQNSLLDFSLQFEVFYAHVAQLERFQTHFMSRYRYMLADNLEEDTPRAHDLMAAWAENMRSVVFILDEQAGFRRFLGADPDHAQRLKESCSQCMTLRSGVQSDDLAGLEAALTARFGWPAREKVGRPRGGLRVEARRYLPETLDWVAEEARRLIEEEGLPPGEIVILAPFLSDSLRFLLSHRLERAGVPWYSHRPSRPLRDEPGCRCLVALAEVCHPAWGRLPSEEEWTHALMVAISGLDLCRASLLAKSLYGRKGGQASLMAFEGLRPEMQERITFTAGARSARLGAWIEAYRESPSRHLDHFFRRIFGEILSQPGFGYHDDLDRGTVASALVDSARKFRWVLEAEGKLDDSEIAREYLRLMGEGVVAGFYLPAWEQHGQEAVLIAPAFTFLMANRPVEIQFWLDIASAGWAERLYQPLTHPYVLNRGWPRGRVWADADETRVRRELAATLIAGLLRRCRRRIYMGLETYSEQGLELKGPLLRALQRVLSEGGSRTDE